MSKKRVIRFTLPNGVKTFIEMVPVTFIDDDDLVCDHCVYGPLVCRDLPSILSEDKDMSFIDDCSKFGDEGEIEIESFKDPSLQNMCPARGTLEENIAPYFPKFAEVLKAKLEERTSEGERIFEEDIKCHEIKKVIKSVCDGTCYKFNNSFNECEEGHSLCILESIIKHNPEKLTKKVEPKKQEDTQEEAKIEEDNF